MFMFFLNDYQFPVLASFFLFFAMIFTWSTFLSSSFLQKGEKLKKLAQFFVVTSNFLFALTLLSRWITEKYFPLSNLYESLIFLAWCISFMQIGLEWKTKSRVVSLVLTPLLFFLASFSSFTLPIELQKALPLVPSLQSNWLMMHVSMMMVSYATLLIGSLFCLFYISFDIGKNQKGLKASLLEILDSWSYRIIGLGFPFLTLGIISGAVWANEAWGSYWSWDPKETWAFITWLVFATYLHSRIVKGWQGKKAAIVGSFGFFVIWVCYLGVNFLAKGLHTYGWILS